MSLRSKRQCFAVFILLFFSGKNALTFEITKINEMRIEIKSIDSTNYHLLAYVTVKLHLPSGMGHRHLVLPFKNNPSLNFFIEPESTKNTMLSGFLNGGYGNFLAQIEMKGTPSDIFLSFHNVRINIHPSSNNDAIGYYRISFESITEDLSLYYNSMIHFDRIHLNDERILFVQPNAIQGNERNTLIFDNIQDTYDITVFISKEKNNIHNANLIMSIIIGIAATLLGILTSLGLGIEKGIKKRAKHKYLFIILSLLFLIIQIIVFIAYTMPTGNYNELTFMSTMSTLFGVSLWFCFIVFYSTRK